MFLTLQLSMQMAFMRKKLEAQHQIKLDEVEAELAQREVLLRQSKGARFAPPSPRNGSPAVVHVPAAETIVELKEIGRKYEAERKAAYLLRQTGKTLTEENQALKAANARHKHELKTATLEASRELESKASAARRRDDRTPTPNPYATFPLSFMGPPPPAKSEVRPTKALPPPTATPTSPGTVVPSRAPLVVGQRRYHAQKPATVTRTRTAWGGGGGGGGYRTCKDGSRDMRCSENKGHSKYG